MSVVIDFTANLADVRAQLDRLIADARKPIQLGFGGGGVGGFSAPGVMNATPTIAGVLGGSRNAVSGAFGSVGGGMTIPGFYAPFAQGGFFNASVAGLSAGVGGSGQAAQMLGFGSMGAGGGGGIPATLAAAGFGGGVPTIAAALASPPGGGVGGGFINIPSPARSFFTGARGGANPTLSSTFLGRGFTGIGAGYLANEALKLAESGREYNILSGLAGNDQRAQLEATLGYRKAVLSFPIVGRLVNLLEDPEGSLEQGIRSTLNGADAGDRKAALLKSAGIARERAGNEAILAETRDPLKRRLEQARIENLERRRTITETGYNLAAADRESLDSQRATLEADRTGRANRMAIQDKTQSYSAAYENALETLKVGDNTSLAQTRQTQADARSRAIDPLYESEERRYAAETKEDRREYDFQRRIESIRVGGQIKAFGFDVANNPRAAELATVVAEGRAAIEISKARREPLEDQYRVAESARGRIAASIASDARADQYRRDDSFGRIGISAALLDHNPLRARERSIDAEADRRLRDPDADRAAVERERVQSRTLAGQEDRERRGLIRMGLAGEGRSLDLLLNDQPTAARGADVATRAREESLRLRYQGDEGNAKQVLGNAIKQEELIVKQYLQSFKPVNVDPTLQALSAPRGGEDMAKSLASISQDIKGLRADLAGGVIASD